MDILKLGDSSYEMPIAPDWDITYYEEDNSKADVRFNTGEYPVLGIKIISLDSPKYNKDNKLKDHLFDPILLETHQDLEIKESQSGVYGIEYQANLESGERVKVWRKATIIGSRTIRLVTLALSWMSNPSSDKVVNKILVDVEKHLEKCIFVSKETELDIDAKIAGRISRLKQDIISPWKGLSMLMPTSWPSEINKKEKTFVSRVRGYEEAMLFLNCDDLAIPNETKITSDYMQHIASSIGEDEKVKDISLHSTGTDTYLISCNKAEEDKGAGIILDNYFWHIFALKNNILSRLHFTYVFPSTKDKFLNSLVNVLDQNIKNIKLD
jgi:hypothetical protein